MTGTRNARRRPGRALGAASIALVLAACGGAPGDGGGGDVADLDGDWRLVDGDHDGTSIDPTGDAEVTLTIDGERWRGTAACNTYDATVRVDGDRVRSEGVAVTEMACEPPELMELERAYLDAFSAVERVETDADDLRLRGADVRLHFARVEPDPDADLVGTRWRLESLIDGDDPDSGVSSTVAEATLNLEPGDHHGGTFTLDTGCAQVDGAYELGDATLRTVPDPPVPGCDDPSVQGQHDHVVALLDTEVAVEVDGPDLRLTAADGRALGFRAPDG